MAIFQFFPFQITPSIFPIFTTSPNPFLINDTTQQLFLQGQGMGITPLTSPHHNSTIPPTNHQNIFPHTPTTYPPQIIRAIHHNGISVVMCCSLITASVGANHFTTPKKVSNPSPTALIPAQPIIVPQTIYIPELIQYGGYNQDPILIGSGVDLSLKWLVPTPMWDPFDLFQKNHKHNIPTIPAKESAQTIINRGTDR